jgi:hypothetical protein
MKNQQHNGEDFCAGNGLYLSITMTVAGCGAHTVPGQSARLKR